MLSPTMTKIKKPTTGSIDVNRRYANILRDVLAEQSDWKPWNRLSASEIVKIATQKAKAEAELWGEVRKEYPESAGKDVTVTPHHVEWEEEDKNENSDE